MKNKKLIITLSSLLATVIIALAGFGIYVSDYYRADQTALHAFTVNNEIKITKLSNDTLIYTPKEAEAGLIFYPGGKVEYTAYEPLMRACADKGIMCVLVKMPFNLAVLNINAAKGIKEQFPEIESWYIGGHSLGGSMAASYISKKDGYKGLVLLAAYSTADLTESELSVLSIYGSEDTVLNKEKYDNYKSNLPKAFTETVINGGNHAYFGMYGNQSGDSNAVISNEKQIFLTAEEIAKFIKG